MQEAWHHSRDISSKQLTQQCATHTAVCTACYMIIYHILNMIGLASTVYIRVINTVALHYHRQYLRVIYMVLANPNDRKQSGAGR